MKRVMICEDNPILALDLAEAVEDTGSLIVGCFSSSLDARAAAHALRPEIAIVDLQLADGDSGLKLALHLVNLGCRVIIVSGSPRNHPELALIPHSFVSKPVPSGVVANLLANW